MDEKIVIGIIVAVLFLSVLGYVSFLKKDNYEKPDLSTPAGQAWLQSSAGGDWLQTPSGGSWLQPAVNINL